MLGQASRMEMPSKTLRRSSSLIVGGRVPESWIEKTMLGTGASRSCTMSIQYPSSSVCGYARITWAPGQRPRVWRRPPPTSAGGGQRDMVDRGIS